MTLSSALARTLRAIGSRIGLVVGVVVLVSALCHLGQTLPGGPEHDAPLSRSSVSISASEAWGMAAAGNESDGHGEHSCHDERSAAANPQAPATPAAVKPAAFDGPATPAALLPLVADQPQPTGPRPHTLCVLRT